MNALSPVARLARPLYAVFSALTYMLGAGIARYLGHRIDGDMLLLGLLAAMLNPIAMTTLATGFHPAADPLVDGESRQERRLVRNTALYTAMVGLASIGFIAVMLSRTNAFSGGLITTFALSLAATILYAVPPMRLVDRGFGDLLTTLQVSYVAPALGLRIQMGGDHSLLYTCVAALVLLLMAVLVVLDLPNFARDIKYDRGTLLTKMGWENGLRIHNIFLLGAYVTLAVGILSGFSFGLFTPALLSLPFAGLQILLLNRMAAGARPIWGLLSANAVAVFALTAYLLALSFWSR